MKVWAKQSGFTIVELLVVIVVIGILAAITIVGYRNITANAATAQYVAAADSWEKLLRLEYANTGSFPVTTGFVCLGSAATDYPAVDGFPSGACVIDGSFTYNQGVMDSFSTLIKNNIPSTKNLPVVGATRGLIYYGILTNYADLAWWAPSKSACGRAVDDWSGGQFGAYAQCHLHLDFR